MLRALVTGAECPGAKSACAQDFSQFLAIDPADNGYTRSFPKLAKRGKEEEWHLVPVTPLAVQVGSATTTSLPAVMGHGASFAFL